MIADGLGEEEIDILRILQEELSNEEIRQSNNLKFVDRKTVKEKNLHWLIKSFHS